MILLFVSLEVLSESESSGDEEEEDFEVAMAGVEESADEMESLRLLEVDPEDCRPSRRRSRKQLLDNQHEQRYDSLSPELVIK